MNKPKINIVWFKRDLRIHDHQALWQASRSGAVLPIYIIEPEYWKLPDTSQRHWQFIHQALQDLDKQLSELGQGLCRYYGDAVTALQSIQQSFHINAVYSHQETGNAWTYARDRRVKNYLQQQAIPWHEYAQFGVIRGSSYRPEHWAEHWHDHMHHSTSPTPTKLAMLCHAPSRIQEPLCQSDFALQKMQNASRAAAEHCLETFLHKRGRAYIQSISAPNSAWYHSSRLSPYLTYGVLSMREVYQASYQRKQAASTSKEGPGWQRSLTHFISRLHWHCHFIQKLECSPRIEHHAMLALAEDLRSQEQNLQHLQAWQTGQTGFPLIDACMRALRAEGWINFRMRALLVSFASYNLWLDWRLTAPYLARLFVDYEPGIHYPQIQMQSGTTGINSIRVYNPVKQSFDQDAKAVFIRRWVPELTDLDNQTIHTPWLLNQACHELDYPPPIVDHELSAKLAKQKVHQLRQHPNFRRLANTVFLSHGSRKKRRNNKRNNESGSQQLLLTGLE